MKREFCAVLLLLILIFISVYNIGQVSALAEDVQSRLRLSKSAAESGDYDKAIDFLTQAHQQFTAKSSYTAVFIRHPELDNCCDAFYQLMDCLYQQQYSPAMYDLLDYHIQSIWKMEELGIGTVF